MQTFFPDVKTISTDDLYDNFITSTLVDIRNPFEFDVVHIASSINLPLDNGRFSQSIKSLVNLKNNIILIIIGNNSDSIRTFEAARIARTAGIKNVSVYNAGIFSWLLSYPGKTQLMGETPAQLEQVLPQIKHQKHLVSYGTFKRYAEKTGTRVIDIRDIYHRSSLPNLTAIRNIAFEPFLAAIGNRIWAENHLLIFDSDGSRTRWLQLFLQASGYYNYFFLDGGIQSLTSTDLLATNTNTTFHEDISINQHQLKQLSTALSQGKHLLTCFNYVLTSITIKNLAFLIPEQAAKDLNISVEQLRTLSHELGTTGYVRFLEIDNTFIYQVDPKIAWKGKMNGSVWQKSIDMFYNGAIE